MGEKLFGTDGIRGVANKYPISSEIALKLGRATGLFVKKKGLKSIVIGKDTRKSGDMLESALVSGIVSTGINALIAGVIPTPGVSYIVKSLKDAGSGIVISASHNPYMDNGLKVFNQNGEKLNKSYLNFIENYINSDKTFEGTGEIGNILSITDSNIQYGAFLKSTLDFRLIEKQIKIVIDCSNGAAFEIAPFVFNEPCFKTKIIYNNPDGENINKNCGSQHTQTLSKKVVEFGYDMGLAFDGDADRLIAVDEKGKQITGDQILVICSTFLKNKGNLENNIVVSTVMSNIGLIKYLNELEIKHVVADVGDINVKKEMEKHNAVIGGEDSGHIIFSKYQATGDGILSALRLIEAMAVAKKPLSILADKMKVYPQVLKNVQVNDLNVDYMKIDEISRTIKHVEKNLGSEGRVLIRYSGTQPLLRVMIEGPDIETIENYCNQLGDVVKKYL